MKILTQDRAELIDAVVAEENIGGLTAAILEKDEHLTDALRAIFSLNFEFAELVFCGGTSLSKAHGLIERMSEDADFKVVLNQAGQKLSRTKLKRYLGDVLRFEVNNALTVIGLHEEKSKAISRNEYSYMQSHWMYECKYPTSVGLRPHLQIELTLRKPALSIDHTSLYALADRLAGRPGVPFKVPTISVAETQSEKVLSFLRRFAAYRAGTFKGEWDKALVRHIYDVHCIFTNHPTYVLMGAPAFAELIRGDANEYPEQPPNFAVTPIAILEQILFDVRTDQQVENEYQQNLLPLVYGSFKPTFHDAFHSFEKVAKQLLDTARYVM